MGRKQWAMTAVGGSLLAITMTGGYGLAGARTALIGENAAPPMATQTAAPTTGTTTNSEPPAKIVSSLRFSREVGPPCTGSDVFTKVIEMPIGMPEPGILHLPPKALTESREQRIIPALPNGDVTKIVGPTGEEARAARALMMAYDTLVAYENQAGAITSPDGEQLSGKAKALYRAAHEAFTAKRYEDVAQTAHASSSAGHAATLARQAAQEPRRVANLAAPPALVDETADDRALCSLHRAYDVIGAAQDAQGEAGTDGAFYVRTARASYEKALNDYSASRYDKAQARAESAAAAATAVLQLAGKNPAGEKLPDVPAPPSNFMSP